MQLIPQLREGMVLTDQKYSYKVERLEPKVNRVVLRRNDNELKPVMITVVETMIKLNEVKIREF